MQNLHGEVTLKSEKHRKLIIWDNYYIFGGLIITLISNLQGNAQDKMCYRNVSQCMTKDKSPYHIGWALPGPFPGSKLRGQITDQITAFFQKRKPSFSDT